MASESQQQPPVMGKTATVTLPTADLIDAARDLNEYVVCLDRPAGPLP